MLEISTFTTPFASCQSWAVPIAPPLVLYISASALASALRMRIAVEQPMPANTTRRATGMNPLRTLIRDSGMRFSRGIRRRRALTANLELRPNNDRCAITLSRTRVLRRSARTVVNLDPYNLAAIDELIDVTRHQ